MGTCPPPPDLHISANPELVHDQTSFQTPIPTWILGFLHFQRKHPHSWVQAGCGKAWRYWGALHSPPPVLTEQQQHPPPSLGSHGAVVRGHRGSFIVGVRSRVSSARGLDPSSLQVALQVRELWPPEPFPLGLQSCGQDCVLPPLREAFPG